MNLFDLFAAEIDKGEAPRKALVQAIVQAAGEVAVTSLRDGDVEELLRQLGIENPAEVAQQIARSAGRKGAPEFRHVLSYCDPQASAASGVFTILSGGGVQGVPRPACMEAHLPRDRKPTREELQKAWEACKS